MIRLATVFPLIALALPACVTSSPEPASPIIPAAQVTRESPVTEREGRVAERESQVGGREGRVAEREGRVAERESQVGGREGRVAEREGRVAERESQVGGREGRVAEREGRVAERESQVGGREGRIAEREGRVAERESQDGGRESQDGTDVQTNRNGAEDANVGSTWRTAEIIQLILAVIVGMIAFLALMFTIVRLTVDSELSKRISAELLERLRHGGSPETGELSLVPGGADERRQGSSR